MVKNEPPQKRRWMGLTDVVASVACPTDVVASVACLTDVVASVACPTDVVASVSDIPKH